MHRWAPLVVDLIVAAVLACGSGCAGSFDAAGYKHPTHPLAVRYADPAAHRFISADWRIDSHLVDENGAPAAAKDGPDYQRRERLEFVANGQRQTFKGPRFELKLLHRRTEGVIWLSLQPIPGGDSEIALRAFVARYANALSERGHFHVSVSGAVQVTVPQFAARVVETKRRDVGGELAVEGTIEVANVNQLKLDPESRHSRVRIVVARPRYFTAVHGGYGGPFMTPLIVVIGYWNTPADFDAGLPDFEAFLKAITM